jgi:hypothetical protein
MVSYQHLKIGFRIFGSSENLKKGIYKKYNHAPDDMCRHVVKDCFNGKYFAASNTNFIDFWTRDFGFCVEALMKQGHEKEVHKTLKFALDAFKKSGHMATTITPEGEVFDIFTYAPDTLAFMLRSIRISNFNFGPYRAFLKKEYQRFLKTAHDLKTGLIKSNKTFSTFKDYAVRKGALYDNVMLWVIADEMEKLGFNIKLDKEKIREKVKKEYWNGEYFYDDMKKKKYVAGDAQIFPFWLGMFSDNDMLKSALRCCVKAKLDKPIPLSYTKNVDTDFATVEIFVRGYQRDSNWLLLGLLFVDLMKRIDPESAENYKKAIAKLITRHKTFPEVIAENGKMLSLPFYHSSTGMLWASHFLTL